jgi:hypothetical protein
MLQMLPTSERGMETVTQVFETHSRYMAVIKERLRILMPKCDAHADQLAPASSIRTYIG